ncbi:MAG: hypothetical protein HZC28_14515 [Spirochaetes bacterium]|nr:hypothetical protein [Spirochaetota bacterium]
MRAFAETFFAYIGAPFRVSLSAGERDLGTAVLLFLIGMVSAALSFLMCRTTSLNPLLFIAGAAAFSAVMLLSLAGKTALCNFSGVFGVKYRKGKSPRTFFASAVSLHGFYLFLLPIACALSAFRILHISSIVVAYAVFSIIILVFFYRAIKLHFDVRSTASAFAVFLLPAFYDFCTSITTIVFLFTFLAQIVPTAGG